MRCKTCDYTLWNLRSRQCPECGSPFKPSDFSFVTNSVRFCCPHCGQDYYGTGLDGHLEPRTFDCVRCGTRIDMDEMVLLPTEGVAEERTIPDEMPWLSKSMGFFSRWWKTVLRGATQPARIVHLTQPESSAVTATWFLVVTHAVIGLLSVLTIVGFFVLMGLFAGMGGGGPGVGPTLVASFVGVALAVVGSVIGAIVLAWLWIAVSHGLLLVTGGTTHGIGRTAHAILYTCGPMLISAVPCVGMYFGWMIGGVWWCVSATIMVVRGQSVGPVRATLCVVGPPATVTALGIAAYIALIFGALSTARTAAVTAAGTARGMAAVAETQSIATAINAFALAQGRPPAHALELVTDGTLSAAMLSSVSTATTTAAIAFEATDLQTFSLMPATQAKSMAARASASLPAGVVAHRVVDFVFTYHGFDPAGPNNAALWVVIHSPDPASNPVSTPGAVGLANGSAMPMPQGMFPTFLQQQNDIRATFGLPPLPDPGTVRTGVSASAVPEDDR
ncbi:MAG: YIP1 family protein [Phycisphaeraceae bacterium]|nr:YIP1 family protein [Phycisphaeraceae bacterium]